MSLTPCDRCGRHVLDPEAACPHCGGPSTRGASTAATVLLGLALVGCPSRPEPPYGVPTMYDDKVPTETSETGTSDTGTAATGTTETGTSDTGATETGTTDTGARSAERAPLSPPLPTTSTLEPR